MDTYSWTVGYPLHLIRLKLSKFPVANRTSEQLQQDAEEDKAVLTEIKKECGNTWDSYVFTIRG